METVGSCEWDRRMRKNRWGVERKKGREASQHKWSGRSGWTSSLVCASPPLCVSSSFSSSLFWFAAPPSWSWFSLFHLDGERKGSILLLRGKILFKKERTFLKEQHKNMKRLEGSRETHHSCKLCKNIYSSLLSDGSTNQSSALFIPLL